MGRSTDRRLRTRAVRYAGAVAAVTALIVGGTSMVSAAPVLPDTGSAGSLGTGTPPTTPPPTTGPTTPPPTTNPGVPGGPTVAKQNTVTAPADQVIVVGGDQAGEHTATLSAGATIPAVGGFLVAPQSAAAPRGVLGRVIAVTADPDGTTTLTLQPARLDEAFDQVKIDTTVNLADSMVEPGAPGTGPAARMGAASGLSLKANMGMLTCTTTVGTEISLSAEDMQSLGLEFHFDLLARQMKMVLTYSPSLELKLTSGSVVSCELGEAFKPRAVIPVGGMIPLFVELEPELRMDLKSGFEATASWGAAVSAGFEVNGSTVTPIGSVSGTADVGYTVGDSASAFLGLSGSLSVAGMVSGGFEVGPKLDLSSQGSCMNATGSVQIAAKFETLIDAWKTRLEPVTIANSNLTPQCGAVPQGNPSASIAVSGMDLTFRVDNIPAYAKLCGYSLARGEQDSVGGAPLALDSSGYGMGTLTAPAPGRYFATVNCYTEGGPDGNSMLTIADETRTLTLPGGLTPPGEPSASIGLVGKNVRTDLAGLPEGSLCTVRFVQMDGPVSATGNMREIRIDASGSATVILDGTRSGSLVSVAYCHWWNDNHTQLQTVLAETRTFAIGS